MNFIFNDIEEHFKGAGKSSSSTSAATEAFTALSACRQKFGVSQCQTEEATFIEAQKKEEEQKSIIQNRIKKSFSEVKEFFKEKFSKVSIPKIPLPISASLR